MDYTPIKRDWPKIMRELRARGLTPYKVATVLGCSHCTAQNWEKGGEPGHAFGEALILLYEATFGRRAPEQQKEITA